MTVDPVRWKNRAGCARCGVEAKYYITAYWAAPRQICPTCCAELNQLYERYGWPPR